MGDRFESDDRCTLRVDCQIMYLDRTANSMVVDLVTLERSRCAEHELPAGTAMTMHFVATLSDETRELNDTMRSWERECAVLDLAVDSLPGGLRYSFASDEQQLILEVDASG